MKACVAAAETVNDEAMSSEYRCQVAATLAPLGSTTSNLIIVVGPA